MILVIPTHVCVTVAPIWILLFQALFAELKELVRTTLLTNCAHAFRNKQLILAVIKPMLLVPFAVLGFICYLSGTQLAMIWLNMEVSAAVAALVTP